jgi:hypothetical protein
MTYNNFEKSDSFTVAMKLFEANQKRDEGELKRSQNKKFAVCS